MSLLHPTKIIPPAKVELEHFFVAVFKVKGQGVHVIEVPHTQKPEVDRTAAWKLIRAKFPKAGEKEIVRSGGAIQSRPKGVKQPRIELQTGATIRQLFVDGTDTETGRLVGTVVFNGQPCDLTLRFFRSKSAWGVSLREIGSSSSINFSEQHTSTRPIADLPELVMRTLGGAASLLHLFIVVKK